MPDLQALVEAVPDLEVLIEEIIEGIPDREEGYGSDEVAQILGTAIRGMRWK